MTMGLKISACVMTHNEQDKIRRCLESLTWCDEIVVVDSFSDDNTVAICREFTDRVYQHEWLGYIGQRNLLLGMAHYEWILFLDADEEISPALKNEIFTELGDGSREPVFVGYQFPRQVYYLGRWIKYGEWYPDIKLRLFKKDFGRSEGREPHDRVVVDGPVKTLRSPLYHYTYDDIFDQLMRMNRYSGITAKEKYAEGIRFHWYDLVLRPPLRFIKAYLFRRGFLDGKRGLIIALLTTMEVRLKYIKLWELSLNQHSEPQAESPPKPSHAPGSEAGKV